MRGRAFPPVMDYHLAPHLSFGFIGADAVVLDLMADRYFRLRGYAATLGSLASAGAASCDAGSLADLVERQLLLPGPGAVPRPAFAPRPAESAIEHSCMPLRGGRQTIRVPVREVLTTRLFAGQWMRSGGLLRTVTRWRGQRARRLQQALNRIPSQDAVRAIACSFAAGRRYFPAKRRCVPDSLALARCLWRRGADAQLYFGVRLEPFAAHCWVQADDLLLSDPIDSIAEFTPVFEL